MKPFFMGIVFLLLIPTTVTAIKWEKGALNIYLSSEAYYQDLSGNEETSIIEKGWFYQENLIFDLNQTLAEKAKFQGYTHIRSSNDPQHQIKRRDVMFIEGYVRFADDLDLPTVYEVWGGDFAESYTPYTFNTSLLGAKTFYKYGDWVKVSILGGRNRDEDLDDYVRYTAGGRVEFYYKSFLTVGGTFIYADVARDSLETNDPLGDELNYVFGTDLHLTFWDDKLHFDAEYAHSIYHEDRRNSTLTDQSDSAILVQGDITPLNNLTISAEFERVEPRFSSALGTASTDLERIKGQVDYAPWDMLIMMLLYEYSFDKLNKHSLTDHRTHTHLTSFSSTVTPFYQREDILNSLAIDIQVDYSNYSTQDHPPTTDQDDLIIYSTVSQSFTHWNYSIGYTYNRYWSNSDRTAELFSHSPSVSLGSTYQWLALDWAWTCNGNYEYRKYILSGLADRIYSGNIGLMLGYERTNSNLSLDVAIEYYDNSPDPQLDVTDNISRSYSATFDQKLWETDKLSADLNLRVSFRDYDEDIAGEDYTEATYYVGLDMQF